MTKPKSLTIAAMADIHVGKTNFGPYQELFSEISEKADILLLCGDLTGRGYPSEAEQLATELQSCRIPVVGVLGNHDYEEDKQDEIKEILRKGKMHFVDEEPFIMQNVGFAGVKGFSGGFGPHLLTPFGEPATKAFAKEGSNEALHLESLLNDLETEKKVVLLHYSPIRETVVNEPVEIFPFLGSSHLMAAIDTYNAAAAFHGHAHHGTLSGKTMKGVPVYNVAYPLMKEHNPKQPYALITL